MSNAAEGLFYVCPRKKERYRKGTALFKKGN